jgi:hypothetical protein
VKPVAAISRLREDEAMEMSKLGFLMMRLFAAWLCLVLPSACSVNPRFLLPIASDQKLEAFLAEEGARLLLVSENAHIPMRYNFYLVKFAREDILGLSLGGHDIFHQLRIDPAGLHRAGLPLVVQAHSGS